MAGYKYRRMNLGAWRKESLMAWRLGCAARSLALAGLSDKFTFEADNLF